MDLLEVAITSDSSGQLCNSSVWDVHSGTCLFSYRGGGVAAPRTLTILGNDYLVSSERTKPMLHIWPLNSHDQVQGLRFVLPGRATALAFSPDGCYCVAGILEKIYVWQISSGNLLGIAGKHYQNITSIKFTDDGSHFVTAGEDGLVIVWNLVSLISDPSVGDHLLSSQTVAGQQDPLYVFSDHSLPVSDIYIGKGGIYSRLVTVSIDKTCKVYDLSSGELLLNLVFDTCLSSAVMDIIETNIFVGTVDGEIYQFSLAQPPRMREYFLNEKDRSLIYSGHSKAVTCLSISMDMETLISGSNDEQVIVWHIPSRQKTHSIPHKGTITNVFFTIVPSNMFAKNFDPSIILHSLQRSSETECDVEFITKECDDFWDSSNNSFGAPIETISAKSAESTDAKMSKMKEEIIRLKHVNAELYNYALQKILKLKNDN